MKNVFLLMLFAFIATSQVQAQEVSSDSIYIEVENPAQFPGGQAAMMAFVYKNIRYPDEAFEKKTQGTAVVTFIVETDGTVSGIEIVKNPGDGIGEELVRVVSMLKGWTSGSVNGVPIRTKMSVPVKFRLD